MKSQRHSTPALIPTSHSTQPGGTGPASAGRRGVFEPAVGGLVAGLALGALLWWAVGASLPGGRVVVPTAPGGEGAAVARTEKTPERLEPPPLTEVPAGPEPAMLVPAEPEPAMLVPAGSEPAKPVPAEPEPAPTRIEASSPPSSPPGSAPPAPPVEAVVPGPWVQVAALESQAEAQATWRALRTEHAALLGSFEPRVLRFVRDGQQFFRLRVGPFASRKEASALCEALRKAGAACFVANEG